MGALVGTVSQHLGGIVATQIIPTEQAQHKREWLRLVRALRSERDQELLELHRQRLSEHLGNVVLFPGGES